MIDGLGLTSEVNLSMPSLKTMASSGMSVPQRSICPRECRCFVRFQEWLSRSSRALCAIPTSTNHSMEILEAERLSMARECFGRIAEGSSDLPSDHHPPSPQKQSGGQDPHRVPRKPKAGITIDRIFQLQGQLSDCWSVLRINGPCGDRNRRMIET